MATIPEYQGDYVYGQISTNAQGYREFECFGTSAKERFYIKGIAIYEKNLTAIFWYVISQIEIFLKVKVAKTWVILTISSDKKGISRTAVLANKIQIEAKLKFDEFAISNFNDPKSNWSAEHTIESSLYLRKFLGGKFLLSYRESAADDCLDKIGSSLELARRLRYTGITKFEFEDVCKKVRDLSGSHREYYYYSDKYDKSKDSSEKLFYQGEYCKSFTKLISYSNFLAKVICRKHEVESELETKVTFDYDLDFVCCDSKGALDHFPIDHALTTTDDRDSRFPITLQAYLARMQPSAPVTSSATNTE